MRNAGILTNFLYLFRFIIFLKINRSISTSGRLSTLDSMDTGIWTLARMSLLSSGTGDGKRLLPTT